ncbi:MAG TPA: alpha/beta hydrolase-fold protein [Prosthecobacter sp.]|nr:alpha/beta hydrolase-fold protein [Prosthecobacter sp.]
MQLEEHTVESSSGEYIRKVWILEPPRERPHKFGIFLDAEIYLHRMDAQEILTHLQAEGTIPPITAVFVSHVDGAARHHDLTCNPKYAKFIAEDLLGWLRDRNQSIPSQGHLIAGPSLGGLASAHLALAYPQTFPHCLSHSGSFWWQEEWLTAHIDQFPASHGNFWISVGDQETQTGIAHPPTGLYQEVAQLPACERFAEALRERGHRTRFSLHEGSHSFEPWEEELPEALAWLLH